MSKTLSVLRKSAPADAPVASSLMVAYALPAADDFTLTTQSSPDSAAADAFTKETSVKVNTVSIKDGMLAE